jgi:predicted dehydrogenase
VHTTETYAPQLLANFIDELDDFHGAIRDDREPAANGLDGLRVVQVTLAMIASARDQRTIRIEPLTV